MSTKPMKGHSGFFLIPSDLQRKTDLYYVIVCSTVSIRLQHIVATESECVQQEVCITVARQIT